MKELGSSYLCFLFLLLCKMVLVATEYTDVNYFDEGNNEVNLVNFFYVYKKPPSLNGSNVRNDLTTPTPYIGVTPSESHLPGLDFTDELLMPGESALEDLLLHREKRQVEGCGDEPVVNASLPIGSDFTDNAAFRSGLESAITSECSSVPELTSVSVTSVDSANSRINLEFRFTSSVNRTEVAKCLRNIQVDGSISVNGDSYDVTEDPFVENAAGSNRAAVCFTCSANLECLRDAANLFYCGTTELFAFGRNQGDEQLPQTDDAVSPSMSMVNSIALGDTTQDDMFGTTNGFISPQQISAPVSQSISTTSINVIAALWTDIDITLQGEVFYRIADSADVNDDNTKATVDRATEEVRRFSTESDFTCKTAIVATWNNVVQKGETDNSKTATFQIVLASSDRSTYALMFYKDFKWTAIKNRKISIGYHLGSTRVINPYSETLGAFNMHTHVGNTGHRGMWIYKVGTKSAIDYEARCLAFFRTELNNRPFYSQIQRLLRRRRSCPITEFRMRFQRGFRRYSVGSDRTCYVSLPVFSRRTFLFRYASMCCYGRNNFLILNQPRAGSLVRNNPLFFPTAYQKNDLQPYEDCCVRSTRNCRRFYQILPISPFRRRSFMRPIWIWGDPHIGTLDGKIYTFNGLGEYLLLKIQDPANSYDFDLQMRTLVFLDENNKQSQATVFGAFVGEDSNGTKFQVEMSAARDRLVMYFMSRDITQQFYNDQNYTVSEDEKLFLERSGDHKVKVTFSTDLSFEISLSLKMLDISMSVPEDYQNMTSGMVGNYDGDKTNDLISRDGVTLADTDNDRLIFETAKTWVIQESESKFIYQDGQTFNDFNSPNFVPYFKADATDAQKAAATLVCGQSASEACIYDYLATNSSSVARATEAINEVVVITETDIANANPNLVANPSEITATIGVQSEIILTPSDEDGDSVSIVEQAVPSSGYSLNRATNKVTWTPANSSPVELRFNAEDSKGANSTEVQIIIKLCTLCSSNGECSNNTRPTSKDPFFQLLQCNCKNGFKGVDCESEVNACDVSPCDPLQTCTDIAGEIPSNEYGYNCSACPSGYTQVGPKCIDIDECNSTNGGCDANSNCINTIGSRECECKEGYRSTGPTTCVDIDECLDQTHNCDQKCINNPGSFTCDCNFGYDLTDATTCVRNATVSFGCSKINCSFGCRIENGKEVCFCPAFQQVSSDSTSCEDVNECNGNICSQKCEDLVPGFKCSCFDGFKLSSDNISCTACDEFQYGEECQNTCSCQGRGTCNPATGCICNEFWTGDDCSTDIDECKVDPERCGFNRICKNLPGSFECVCPTGYTLNGNNCEDINECDTTANNCEQKCDNTPGSFACSCNEGYILNNGTCEDVNECDSKTSQCHQECSNVPGSYNCFCRVGFTLGNDRKTCTRNPAKDPCKDLTPLNCEYGCRVNNNSQAECYCRSGFRLNSDGKTCSDINECGGSHDCSDICVNTDGSYTCSCSIGSTLSNDRRTCQPCGDNKWGLNCVNDCDCSVFGSVRCNKTIGCECKTGWIGDKCDSDIDECSTQACTISGSVCQNSPGSFACNCPAGYQLSSDKSKCENVDECKDSNLHDCDQDCTDTIGSFICSCRQGFVRNTQTDMCDDINECDTKSDKCEQNCRNNPGSFFCECQDGYTLNTDRLTCRPIAQCDNPGACNQTCAKINSTDTCSCSDGFTVSGNNCINIDECDSKPCINGTCTDLTPSFSCSCSNGSKLQSDTVTCLECDEGFYGEECSSKCTCQTSNTLSCDKVTGTCNCKSGWQGDTCDVDINECIVTPNICNSKANSRCINQQGSHICQCLSGYFATSGVCKDCSSTTYGFNCEQTCSCVAQNTERCDKANGDCICKAGWTGATCSENVNECNTPNICTGEPNVCVDTIGSFECQCPSGFRKTASLTCQNIDECVDISLHNCTQTGQKCVDTNGGFNCQCQDGYLQNGNTCQDINECSVANGGCESGCTNSPGSFQCSCPVGLTLNPRNKKTCYSNPASNPITLTLDITDQNAAVQNTNSFNHQKLKTDIASGVYNSLTSVNDTGIIDVQTTSLSLGSVVAALNIITQQPTDAQLSSYAKAIHNMIQGGSVNVDGVPKNIISLAMGNNTLTSSSDLCAVFATLKTCATGETCQVVNNLPTCMISETEDNLPLIIGLSVGIPAFFIALAILICVIWLCVKRRRRLQSNGSDRITNFDRRDPFQSVFSGQVPKRGGWAASRYGLYSPDTLSQASGVSEDSDGKLIKSRQKSGRADFRDSAWNDNRSYSQSAPDNAQPANFSWEYMFQALEPMRNFEIQRPHVEASPVRPHKVRQPDSRA